MVGKITRKDGYLYGPWVRPRNLAANSTGSIHEDETARQYGMRGALVSGRLHLPAFAPLLAEVYGNDWFEHGTLFVEFRYGTLDQEEVRAVLQEPSEAAPAAPVQARLERPDGKVVARGTAAMGLHLRALDLTSYDRPPYTILEDLYPGRRFPEVPVTLTREAAERMHTASPSLPWFIGPSPWDGPIASPALLINALTSACTAYRREHPIGGVPVDGAYELRNLHGPLFLDRPYRVWSEVIGRGQSPKTEYIWYESHVADEVDRCCAELRMQLRFMKRTAGATLLN